MLPDTKRINDCACSQRDKQRANETAPTAHTHMQGKQAVEVRALHHRVFMELRNKRNKTVPWLGAHSWALQVFLKQRTDEQKVEGDVPRVGGEMRWGAAG